MTKLPSTATNQRLYVVGDIHGRADLLTRLVAMIEADAMKYPAKKKKLIFLGDYIDRGLDSKGVIERLTQPFAENLEPVFIRGNHDQYLLSFLDGDKEIASRWLQFGGTATIASYGVNPFNIDNKNKDKKMKEALLQKMPATHVTFLENTLFSASFGNFFFVHAGVRPGIPLAQQTPEDKMGIREDFLFSDHLFEAVIIHGHTISPKPEVKRNRIGLDTGAFATGHLTCLVLEGTKRGFLAT